MRCLDGLERREGTGKERVNEMLRRCWVSRLHTLGGRTDFPAGLVDFYITVVTSSADLGGADRTGRPIR